MYGINREGIRANHSIDYPIVWANLINSLYLQIAEGKNTPFTGKHIPKGHQYGFQMFGAVERHRKHMEDANRKRQRV